MIYIGLNDASKIPIIERYRAANGIRKVVVISADAFPLPIPGTDQIKYSDVIMYVTFYRLLQEIDQHTLIVINECLRTQNRYDLSYNCIRNYLNQTTHQLIFQQLPQIDTVQDFMILFDFDTRSRWKREKFDINLVLDYARVEVQPLPLAFDRIAVPTSDATRRKYAAERGRLLADLGPKDPHTLPRNLYLIGGKDKLAWIDAQAGGEQLALFDSGQPRRYVARNKRLGRDSITTYGDATPGEPYTVVELPHRFIEYADFIKRTGQAAADVLAANLKVDAWYCQRYQDWKERICETYASLQQ